MGTDLNPEEMKAFVRRHFEDFVNNQRAEVIRKNMAPDFLDHNGPGDTEVGIAEDEQMMLGSTWWCSSGRGLNELGRAARPGRRGHGRMSV